MNSHHCTETIKPCLPVQTVWLSADTSTRVILLSRQRDFTQQLVCGHAAKLVNRLRRTMIVHSL